MSGKNLAEWGYVRPAEFDGPDRFNDIARLLGHAVIEYATFNSEFCSNYRNPDFPFGWGELQNQGILFHSCHHALRKGNYQELIIPEYAYTLNKYQFRNRKPPERHRVDLWISLRRGDEKKEVVLLLEYKHIWVDEHVMAIGHDSWKDDWQKLGDATKRQYRRYFTTDEMSKSDMVKMLFMTLVIYHESEEEENIGPLDKRNFASHMGDIRLNPEQNWIAYWWLPDSRQRVPSVWMDDQGSYHYTYYRGLYFLARLESVSK